MTDQRLWVVRLHARGAVRIADNKQAFIAASPESTLSVFGVRIRNDIRVSTSGESVIGTIVEAGGLAKDGAEAASLLANLGSPYFQAMATACNAAIAEPTHMTAYAPPLNKADQGAFVVQKQAGDAVPCTAFRDVDIQDLQDFFSRLDTHPRQDRLQRAMAHYRAALTAIAPRNSTMSGEFLFIAVENLGRVVQQRLFQEAGLPDDGPSKHELAVRNGFKPRDEKDRSHLGKFDAWVREHHIFNDDRDCYKALVKASDAFEHGLEGFDVVRAKANAAANKSFVYIRRAILREIGVPVKSSLFAEKFDHPIGIWPPALEVWSTYTDTDANLDYRQVAVDGNKPWPEFSEPTITPQVGKVVDGPNKTRDVALTAPIVPNSLLPNHTVQAKFGTNWQVPTSGPDRTKVQATDLKVLREGKDVTAEFAGKITMSTETDP